MAPADGVVTLAATTPFTLEGRLLIVDHGMGLQRLSALPEPGREGRRPGGAGAAARHRRTDRARDGAAPPLGAEMARRAPRPGDAGGTDAALTLLRSEEHTSELQSLMRISYAVFCLQKKNINHTVNHD